MRKYFIGVIFLSIAYLSANGQTEGAKKSDCTKCNSDVVPFFDKKNLTVEQIVNFLCTLDESCKNAAEFSQVSNEMLFRIFWDQPKLSLEILNNHPEFSIDYILRELTQPINDSINVQKLYSKIYKIKGCENVKKKILESLRVAIDNR